MRHVTVWLLSIFSLSGVKVQNIRKFQFAGTAQGTSYHITYYSFDSTVTQWQFDSIFNKIDSSLSLYKPFSLITRFNDSPDGLVADKHLRNIVDKAIDVYKKSSGVFDITVYPLTELWGFGVRKVDSPPSSAAVQARLPCIGSYRLLWKANKLYKTRPCVKLDPNGIAQGYTVDVIADFLELRNVKNYLVELGGEIRVKGHRQPGHEKMKIAIEVPPAITDHTGIAEKIVALDQGALTTSGNYRKFYESGGKRVSHIINPKTGYPVQNELLSVTVFAQDAITADGYDNTLMAMGLRKAMAFIESRKDLAAYFIFQRSDGEIADTCSTRFCKLLEQ